MTRRSFHKHYVQSSGLCTSVRRNMRRMVRLCGHIGNPGRQDVFKFFSDELQIDLHTLRYSGQDYEQERNLCSSACEASQEYSDGKDSRHHETWWFTSLHFFSVGHASHDSGKHPQADQIPWKSFCRHARGLFRSFMIYTWRKAKDRLRLSCCFLTQTFSRQK